MDLTLTLVQSEADKRRFYNLAWQVYKDDPYWVPHLWPQRKAYLDKKTVFFNYGEGDFWLARLGGQVVGSLGAAINHAHNRNRGRKDAVFGFFEVLPAGTLPGYGETEAWEVARRMWDNACGWAGRRGMEELIGPYSFNLDEEQGFLVEGHDSPPAILMGHSHPSYPEWAQRYGFTVLNNTLAYRFDLEKVEVDDQGNVRNGPDLELLQRIAGRARQRNGVHVIRHPKMKDWDAEIERLYGLYNRSLSVLPDFTPIELSEFLAQAQDLKPLLDLELVFIAEVEGQPAGFALGLPNLAEALRHANGLRYPWDFVRLTLARRHITGASFKILAIDPAYWGHGLEAAIFLEMGETAVRKGYTWLDLSLTNEQNPQTNKLARRFGARVYRKYHEYKYVIV
jgi:GNAT superfamily N-acetyltransferase